MKLADAIRSASRATDFIGRVKGKEFIVVFVDPQSKERVIARLLAEVGRNVSVGFHIYSGRDEEPTGEVVRIASCEMRRENERKISIKK